MVHPSYVESQCLVALEALALNIPCVITKSSGPLEYIKNGENGLIADWGGEALANTIMSMINDSELYQKIKTQSFCPEQFMPEIICEKIENLIH